MSEDQQLIERFLEMMAAERGAAANTIAAYRRDLELVSGQLAGKMGGADRSALTELPGKWQDLAASTVARRASSLRRFYSFLEEEGLRDDNPSAALPRPAQARALPKILSREDIERLFAYATDRAEAPSAKPGDVRLMALLELLYGSGLRASELVSLPRNSVVAEKPFVILKGKGGKERLVPVSERARDAVLTWQSHVPEKSAFLFPSRKTHITRVRLFQILRDCAAAAGLDPSRVSPHVLRHAFATHLLAGGANLRALQAMLGHADIATTQIYTHVDASKLVELVNKRHPLADKTLAR